MEKIVVIGTLSPTVETLFVGPIDVVVVFVVAVEVLDVVVIVVVEVVVNANVDDEIKQSLKFGIRSFATANG